MSRPAAFLLDALGTLVGIEPPWRPLTDLLAGRHGVVVDEDRVRRALGAEMAYYRTHCLGAADAASLDCLRDACAEVVGRELGAAVAGLDPDELKRALLDSLRFSAYPEVAGTLGRLRAGGARLVVVSNWDVSLADALGQAGLADLVDGVVCSAAVGAAKPATAIFDAALALAGVRPDQAIHVGDSYDEDVAGARGAGIEPVLLARAGSQRLVAPSGGGWPGDVRTIAGLDELVDPPGRAEP